MIYPRCMDVVKFTRQLVDIESISGNEGRVGDFLHQELSRLGFQTEQMLVEGNRLNVWATWPDAPKPDIVFSTHMDTVPPYVPFQEDEEFIYGRGVCDAKGIIAAQVAAAEALRAERPADPQSAPPTVEPSAPRDPDPATLIDFR